MNESEKYKGYIREARDDMKYAADLVRRAYAEATQYQRVIFHAFDEIFMLGMRDIAFQLRTPTDGKRGVVRAYVSLRLLRMSIEEMFDDRAGNGVKRLLKKADDVLLERIEGLHNAYVECSMEMV